MALAEVIDADAAEPWPDALPCLAPPPAAETTIASSLERFPLLGRFAGAIWFGLLCFGCSITAAHAAQAAFAGPPSVGVIAGLVGRFCVAILYAIICWIMIFRPHPVAASARALPVFAAFLGTYGIWLAPLLPLTHLSPELSIASATIVLIGDALIIVTICKLGASFSIAPQARALVTTGPYRIVRHPLYAVEEIATIGMLMQHAWWVAVPFFVVHLGLQIRRMIYEEAVLRAAFPEYEAYARRTARLIPGVW
jgi:protein-S-isoprenylcysteine O-methyltransferase Ste14